MLPYYILLSVVLLFAYQYDKMSPKTIWPLVFTFITMTLFIGLRDASVGTDTGSYTQIYDSVLSLDSGDKLQWNKEPGFYLISRIGRYIGSNYAILLCLIAGITYTSVLCVLRKLSQSMLISLFIYITLCYSTFCANAARQGIAVGIYMLSFPYLLKKDFKRYVLWVLVAAMFHKTAIITIPMYFLFRMKFSIRTVICIVLGSIALIFILPVLLSYGASMEDRYQLYLNQSSGNGVMLMAFYIIMMIYFIVQRIFITNQAKPIYDAFLLMFISGSIIYIIVISIGLYIELTRFAAYFQVAAIFLWPMILKNPRHKITIAHKAIIIWGHLVFMAIYLTRMANLVPYTLNQTLFE